MDKKLKELMLKLRNAFREWIEVENEYGFDNDETGKAFNDYEDAEHELIDYIIKEWKED